MNAARHIAGLSLLAAVAGSNVAHAQLPLNAPPGGVTVRAPVDTQDRPRAVTHSNAFYVALKVHRIASYAELPLFAVQYYAGEQLRKDDAPGWARSVHGAGSAGLGVLFGVNTVTGVWNLVETWNEPGRTRRLLHTTLMLAADAGFVWTANSAPDDDDNEIGDDGGDDDVGKHRNIALGSMGLATVGTVMMWFWK